MRFAALLLWAAAPLAAQSVTAGLEGRGVPGGLVNRAGFAVPRRLTNPGRGCDGRSHQRQRALQVTGPVRILG